MDPKKKKKQTKPQPNTTNSPLIQLLLPPLFLFSLLQNLLFHLQPFQLLLVASLLFYVRALLFLLSSSLIVSSSLLILSCSSPLIFQFLPLLLLLLAFFFFLSFPFLFFFPELCGVFLGQEIGFGCVVENIRIKLSLPRKCMHPLPSFFFLSSKSLLCSDFFFSSSILFFSSSILLRSASIFFCSSEALRFSSSSLFCSSSSLKKHNFFFQFFRRLQIYSMVPSFCFCLLCSSWSFLLSSSSRLFWEKKKLDFVISFFFCHFIRFHFKKYF